MGSACPVATACVALCTTHGAGQAGGAVAEALDGTQRATTSSTTIIDTLAPVYKDAGWGPAVCHG